jgi:hypothetical protein
MRFLLAVCCLLLLCSLTHGATLSARSARVGQITAPICYNYTMATFEGGSGPEVTVSNLNVATFGATGHWYLPASNAVYSSFQKDLVNPVTLCSGGRITGTGSASLRSYLTGSAFYQPPTFYPSNTFSKMSVGVWLKHNVPSTNQTPMDIFTIYGVNNTYVNAKLIGDGTGSALTIAMESHGDTDIYSPTGKVPPNTWFWVTMIFDSTSDSAANMRIKIYDTSLNLVEDLANTDPNPLGVTTGLMVELGMQNGGPGAPWGVNVYGVDYDNLKIDSSAEPAFPLMP